MTLKVRWERIINSRVNLSPKPICNWINLGNGSVFLISAFHASKIRRMAESGIMVAINRGQSFIFSNPPYDYRTVSEELAIGEGDARNLADWINSQFGYFEPNQGIYSREKISEGNKYYNTSLILRPEIIEG